MRVPVVIVAVVAAGAVARADDRQAARRGAPRWRLRATVAQGFGGGRAGDDAVARFPTLIDVGARVWGPLSLDATFTGTLAGEYSTACGQAVRPNAVAGTAGVRADLANGKSAVWVAPWVEVHGGVGAQSGAREVPGGCPAATTFPTAGARAGFDAWLGRGGVTVALAFDYLPVGASVSFVLGGSFVVF